LDRAAEVLDRKAVVQVVVLAIMAPVVIPFVAAAVAAVGERLVVRANTIRLVVQVVQL
jgi:hypothetical protein